MSKLVVLVFRPLNKVFYRIESSFLCSVANVVSYHAVALT